MSSLPPSRLQMPHQLVPSDLCNIRLMKFRIIANRSINNIKIAAATADLSRDTDAKCRNVPDAQNNHRSVNDHAKSILVKDNHVNMFRAVSSLTLRFTGESEM
jgi:hypothetical protein